MQAIYGYDVAADLQAGCRYDEVVKALGGAGEVVSSPNDLGLGARPWPRGRRAVRRERAHRSHRPIPQDVEPRVRPDELAAREQVRHTIAAYAHAVDRGRFDEAAACFTADGVLDVRGSDRSEGRDAIAARFAVAGQKLAAASTKAIVRHHVSSIDDRSRRHRWHSDVVVLLLRGDRDRPRPLGHLPRHLSPRRRHRPMAVQRAPSDRRRPHRPVADDLTPPPRSGVKFCG